MLCYYKYLDTCSGYQGRAPIHTLPDASPAYTSPAHASPTPTPPPTQITPFVHATPMHLVPPPTTHTILIISISLWPLCLSQCIYIQLTVGSKTVAMFGDFGLGGV